MAKVYFFQHIIAVQVIFFAVSIIFVSGSFFKSLNNLSKSTIRSIARVPSQAMDGSQFITQKVAGSVASVVSPVKPLKYAVDTTGGAVSNVLGSTSRLLGKSVKKPHRMIFLYGRSIKSHGTSQAYQEAIRLVVGHALTNVMLYPEDMQSGQDEPADLSAMPVLESLVGKLKRSGAPDSDLEAIVKVLGRNGKEDLPSDIEPKVISILNDIKGKFKTTGPIEEIRWIAQNPTGFYMMENSEMTDYKLKTNRKYSGYSVILPPIIESTENK